MSNICFTYKNVALIYSIGRCVKGWVINVRNKRQNDSNVKKMQNDKLIETNEKVAVVDTF